VQESQDSWQVHSSSSSPRTLPIMEYLDPVYQQYSHQGMPPYPDAHNMQHYAMAQQSAAMMPMPTGTKTNETKPRLGKDEVDILEREFKKNPKPTTQTKRQFAEDMGVDLARINVSSDEPASPPTILTYHRTGSKIVEQRGSRRRNRKRTKLGKLRKHWDTRTAPHRPISTTAVDISTTTVCSNNLQHRFPSCPAHLPPWPHTTLNPAILPVRAWSLSTGP
jgi:hypothetical protein